MKGNDVLMTCKEPALDANSVDQNMCKNNTLILDHHATIVQTENVTYTVYLFITEFRIHWQAENFPTGSFRIQQSIKTY